jgi:hypothetical protein
MIRTILSLALVASLAATTALKADPPSKKKKTSHSAPKVEPATPLASGWSYNSGVWTHVDGYKLVNGQVVRSGIQTHKKAPPPPTKAEMDSVLRKKPAAAKTAAEIAAEKEAQRQRNLAPRPAPQTGTHL